MATNRLNKIVNRFTGAFHVPSRHEIETEYLNGSNSLYDLERRMREIDRGKFRGI